MNMIDGETVPAKEIVEELLHAVAITELQVQDFVNGARPNKRELIETAEFVSEYLELAIAAIVGLSGIAETEYEKLAAAAESDVINRFGKKH